MTDILVLCYHAVSSSWPAVLSVTPEQLDTQLGLLVERGYRGATFTAAAAGPASDKTLVVTFDDGYRSVFTEAWPILRSHGVPATLFLTTDWVGAGTPMSWDGIDRWRGGAHGDELLPVTWDDVADLVAGGWEVGSHSCSHRRMTGLDDEALAYEVEGSRARLRSAFGECSSIAYPYGAADERVAAAAARAGYTVGAVLERRPVARGLMRWPRVGVYHGDDLWRFRLKVSPLVRRLRATTLPGASSGRR